MTGFERDDSEKTLGERVAQLEERLGHLTLGATLDVVPIHVFDGGKAPVRQTEGAIGFDAYARAVVDAKSKPDSHEYPPLRRCMADFQRSAGYEERIDASVADWVVDDPNGRPDMYALAVPPGKMAMVGLGFTTGMDFPVFYWVAPRSGHASRGIGVPNSPGTVDPDYRGEAGVLIENRSDEPFVIAHHMRIAQVVFMAALIPQLEQREYHDLPPTHRGAGGFGSTGTMG